MEMTHNNSYPMSTNPVLTPCKQGAVHFSPRPYAQYRWATRCKQRAIHCVFNENEHLTHTLRSKVRYFYVTPSTLETPRSDCEAFLRRCHQELNWGHKAKFLRPVLCSTNKNAPQITARLLVCGATRNRNLNLSSSISSLWGIANSAISSYRSTAKLPHSAHRGSGWFLADKDREFLWKSHSGREKFFKQSFYTYPPAVCLLQFLLYFRSSWIKY